ncbi:hypothetical protein HDU87_004056 [Geranomyces variabilis]|uniref:DUF885 domain-containing protein n=1 Tax=Geranomyces variabilis TaxID=109894 RepID=A0AAD5TT66_9FUNG|nr:hypothetical protein HDU87_004056 [Geranomyces variabilis]
MLTAASPSSPPTALTAILDALVDAVFKENPVEGSLLNYPKYKDEIFDRTNKAVYLADTERLAGELDALDTSALSDSQKELIVVAKIFVKHSRMCCQVEDLEDMPCSHMAGPIPALWMCLTHQSALTTAKDIENFRSRLTKVASRWDQVIDGFRRGINSGVTLPLRSIDLLIKACNGYIQDDDAVAKNPWNVEAQVVAAGLPATYLLDAIRTSVIPGHRKLQAFLRDEYRQHARKHDGLYGLPGGEKLYRDYLEYHTDSSGFSADEIHAIGLEEVARIASEMEATMAKIGFRGTIKEFNAALKDRTKFPQLYLASADDVIPRYQALLRIIDAKMPEYFSIFPAVPCDIQAVPEHQQGSVPGAMYFPGNHDKPGKFLVNLALCKDEPTTDMLATALHEANPGHHHQLSISLECKVDHDIRKLVWSTCFGEGWGLYSEFLGVEMGLYSDPLDYIGRLQLDMHRALRLVVDTGLHHLGWSIEQVIDTMAEYLPTSRKGLESEAVRYAAMPGQACAYKIGEIQIRRMRARATDKLGDRFDLRAFHDLLMSRGSAPMGYFELAVDAWIEKQSERVTGTSVI